MERYEREEKKSQVPAGINSGPIDPMCYRLSYHHGLSAALSTCLEGDLASLPEVLLALLLLVGLELSDVGVVALGHVLGPGNHHSILCIYLGLCSLLNLATTHLGWKRTRDHFFTLLL